MSVVSALDSAPLLNIDALQTYLQSVGVEFQGRLKVRKFAGGQSNPTFLLCTDRSRYVLRRQPSGELAKGAHALDREFKVLSALSVTSVPVPRVQHFCARTDVLGAQFYLMDYIEGRVLWDPALPEVSKNERRAHYRAAIDTLSALHKVDVDAVGLGDYGRRENYFSRQLEVWKRQYRASQTEHFQEMELLIEWLERKCPAKDSHCSVVHGDFRIDNLMFSSTDASVDALLDWELSTLGNPVADLAYFCMCLRLPSDGYIKGLQGLDRLSLGIPEEAEMLDWYSDSVGRQVTEDWRFALAFSFFRLSAIAQGVMKRSISGNASNAQAREAGQMAGSLAQQGWAVAQEA